MNIVKRLLLFLLSTTAFTELPAEDGVDKSEYHLFNPTPPSEMRVMSIDGPGGTESPYTVDAGHFQMETTLAGYSSYEDVDAGIDYRVDVWNIGPVTLKLGLWNAVDLQLVLEPYYHIFEREADYFRDTREGFGDTSLRLKVNLWGNDAGQTALALTPFITFPTSSEGIGDDHVEGGLLVPFSLELPWQFYLGLTTGIGSTENVLSDGRSTEFRNSACLSREIFLDLEAYAEFFSSVSTEEGTEWVGTFDTGLIYWLSDNLQIYAGVNLGLTSWADDLYGFGGMAWRY